MKIIIVGCGKFGTRLANYLNNQNHDVTIIDNREEAFNNLGGNFTGRTVLGMGYDKDVLESAGIKVADALISCSSSDAINAVVSNIAHNIYHVNNVIARMYDKSKARIFRSMGIHTISITDLFLTATLMSETLAMSFAAYIKTNFVLFCRYHKAASRVSPLKSTEMRWASCA